MNLYRICLLVNIMAIGTFSACKHAEKKTTVEKSKDSLDRLSPYTFDKTKPYPFKTGIIMYQYSGDYKGTQTLYFRNFGKEQRVKDSFINTKSPFENLTYKIYINDTGKYYVLDMVHKNGYFLAVTDSSTKMQGNLLQQMAAEGIEKTMQKNGYNLKGIEKIADKNCRIYTSGDSKFCFYNGMNIKTDLIGSGFKYELEAIKIIENPTLPDSLFVPDPHIKLMEYTRFVKSQTRDKL